MKNREIDALVAERVMGIARVFKTFNTAEPYSTDPAASKALRDKMRADGWNYEINASKRDGIWVSFSHPGTVEDFTTYGDTEELAAALAALKAHGVEA